MSRICCLGFRASVYCYMKSFLLKRMTAIVSHIRRNIVYCDMKSFLLKRMTEHQVFLESFLLIRVTVVDSLLSF